MTAMPVVDVHTHLSPRECRIRGRRAAAVTTGGAADRRALGHPRPERCQEAPFGRERIQRWLVGADPAGPDVMTVGRRLWRAPDRPGPRSAREKCSARRPGGRAQQRVHGRGPHPAHSAGRLRGGHVRRRGAAAMRVWDDERTAPAANYGPPAPLRTYGTFPPGTSNSPPKRPRSPCWPATDCRTRRSASACSSAAHTVQYHLRKVHQARHHLAQPTRPPPAQRLLRYDAAPVRQAGAGRGGSGWGPDRDGSAVMLSLADRLLLGRFTTARI
jgi:hypothetical protein